MVRMFGSSTPGLAMNFIGETVGVVSLSYFFHRTGHRKLERDRFPGQHRKLRRRRELRIIAPLSEHLEHLKLA